MSEGPIHFSTDVLESVALTEASSSVLLSWGPELRAVFLDRDGVINYNSETYVKSWDEFRFIPGAITGLRDLTRAGYRLVVVTNQSPINRGVLSAGEIEEINRRMVDVVAAGGGRIDGVFYCPHRPDENCECRKPRPGLILRAAEELGLDLAQCYMIGDYITDIRAAQASGCRPVFVLSGRGEASTIAKGPPDLIVARDLQEAARLIVEQSGEWADNGHRRVDG